MQSNNSKTSSGIQGKVYDEGLRSHMSSVYNRMSIGVLITGLIAYITANTGLGNIIVSNQILYFVIIFSPLAVLMFGFNPATMPSSKLRFSFGLISVLYGLSFSVLFMVYAGADIARAFFITAGAFAGLSLFGYTTKKNLEGFGSFLTMGVIGLLILMVVNMFVQSSLMQNVISAAGILIFGGLTAWDTQKTKEMYSESYGDEANSRMAWMAALSLYINFIMMFQFIMNFVGGRD